MARTQIPGYRKAELAGLSRVSMSTVEKFLRGRGKLQPATEKALEDAAKQIGLDVQAFRDSLGAAK